jgi:UDP-N-acetylglucosamine acyltransferase
MILETSLKNATQIHPTAIIDPTAIIGEGVVIGPFCVVGAYCVIEKNCHLMHHVVVHPFVTMAEGVVLHPFSVIGGTPQDLKFKGDESYTYIGPRTVVREHVTIHRATEAGEITRVGANCLIMAGAHVAHDCVVEDEVILANQVMLAGHVHVGHKAILGGGAGVHQHCKIGQRVMIGGLSKITQDVPPFVLVDGNPAFIKGLNVVGLTRQGMDSSVKQSLKEALSYLSLPKSDCLAHLESLRLSTPAQVEVDVLIDFISHSTRGLVKYHVK